MNPADHQHALLRFHLSSHIRGQFAVARVDLARFQRTSESAHHSTIAGQVRNTERSLPAYDT